MRNGADFEIPARPKISEGDVVRWDGQQPPEVRFTIADLAPEGMVTLLTANGGAGKTLLQQTSATCLAAGKTFLGKSTQPGNAAGIFAEDPESVLHARQIRINEYLGVDYEQLAGRLFIQSYFGHDAALWRDRKPTIFMSDLEGQLREIEGLKLIALDNAAILFNGDESDRNEVTAFMQSLNGIADRLQAGIILSTHGSKSQDGTPLRAASGSTAWINASRSVLELVPANGEEPATLTVIKANHAASGEAITLEWQDKLLVPTAKPDSFENRIRIRSLDDVIFARVAEGWNKGQPYSGRPQAAEDRYLPRLIARTTDFKAKEARTALESWLASGNLEYRQVKGRRREGLMVARERFIPAPDSLGQSSDSRGVTI
jgi:hypothetical protein